MAASVPPWSLAPQRPFVAPPLLRSWLPGYAHPDNWDKMKEIEAQTKQLADFGWKEKERDPEDSWLRWPYEVDHKYIRLTYRGIS